MFIIAIWLMFTGYTLVYYGVGMWKGYATPTNVADTSAIPLAILLGLQKPGKSTGSLPIAKLPFNLGGSIFGTTPHTTALTKQAPTQPKVTQL